VLSLQVAEPMSFDFRKWYESAHCLVVLIADSRHWAMRDAHAKSEAEAAAILLKVQAIREGQAKLREDMDTLWRMLEAGYFDLRDFKTEGLPGGRCALVAIESLARKAIQVGEIIGNARQFGLSLTCSELALFREAGELQDACLLLQANNREKVDLFFHCRDWLERTVDAIHARLALEKSWLLKHATHPLVTTQGEATPPSPPKEKNKGGRPPDTTPERAEQVQRWWGQFLGDPKPKGYQTPKYFRKRSEDDFLAWGEFLKLPNFPTNRDEVKSCKKRYRDLQRQKAAKTKTRKRR
jgi:hypothetical protein